MKQTKQIDTFYCDYCGKECEHTPEFTLPVKEKNKDMMFMWIHNVPVTERVVAKQRDICPKCQERIIKLINDMEKMIYMSWKNTKD